MVTEIASLSEITAAQAQKEVTHNTALRELEGRLFRVKDRDVGTTPASPVNGDTYIVDQLGGAWSTAVVNDIAHFFGGAWNFYTPFEGLRIWVNDEDIIVVYNGAAWIRAAIADLVDDTTPQLGGNLDVNGFTITSVTDGNIVIDADGTGELRIGDDTIIGSTSVAPDGTLHVHTASAGAVTAATTADDLVVENSTTGGISILVPDASVGNIFFGSPADNLGALITYQQSTGEMRIGTHLTGGQLRFDTAIGAEAMRIDANGALLIGDTTNAKMTVGLTINQGANDDEVLALKSSDVGHVFTAIIEADTYATFQKDAATAGGLLIRGITEAISGPGLVLQGLADGADSTKTGAGRGQLELVGHIDDGANNIGNSAANDNIVVIRTQRGGSDTTLFIVDTEGDIFADAGVATTNMVTLFDGEEDIALCRAFDLVRAERGGVENQLIHTEWDDWASSHEDRLVELGILGADGKDGSRGLVNITQLQRLHNGAICQLHSALMETQERLALTERKLALLN